MKSKFTFIFLALTSLAVSCKKEEPAEPAKRDCGLLGIETVSESRSNSFKITETSTHDFELTDDHLPLLLKKSWESSQADTVSKQTGLQTTGSYSQRFTYDKDGYLTQRTDQTSETKAAGELSNIFYEDQGPVKKLVTETTVKTDFKYENGLVTASTYQHIKTYRSEPRPDITVTYQIERTYTYDTQKNLATVTDVDSRGFRSISKYENGLIVSLTGYNQNQQTVSLFENANGKMTKNILSDGSEIRYQYDQRGNLINLQITGSNKVPYLIYEYTYDSNPNPETLVSTKFKGIPLPVSTIQVTDGVNNKLLDKTTSYSGGNPLYVTEYNITHSYNSSGFPLSSLAKAMRDNWNATIRTTYKYANCP